MRTSMKLDMALCATMFATSYSVYAASTMRTFYSFTDQTPSQIAEFSIWQPMAYQIIKFVTALLFWPASRLMGRKTLCQISIVLSIIIGIVNTTVLQDSALLAAYCLIGVSQTLAFIALPLWAVENSSTYNRGQRVLLLWLYYSTAGALGEWFHFGISYSAPNIVRLLPGLQFIWHAVALILLYRAPESYRWLLTHAQHDRARSIYLALHPQSTSTDFANLQDQAIRHSNIPNPFSRAKLPIGTPNLHTLRRLLIPTALQAVVPMTGLRIANLYYSTYQGSSGDRSRNILSSVIPTIDAVSCLPALFLLPRLGFRKLLLLSLLTITLCHLLLLILVHALPSTSPLTHPFATTTTTTTNPSSDHDPVDPGLYIFLLVFFLAYNLGLYQLPWLLQSELPPSLTNIDAGALTAGMAVAARTATETATVWGDSEAMALGVGRLGIYLGLGVVFAVGVWAVVPETVGRGLEDVDRGFVAGTMGWFVGRDREAKRVWRQGRETVAAAGGGVEGRWYGGREREREEEVVVEMVGKGLQTSRRGA